MREGHVVTEPFALKTLPQVSFPEGTPVYVTVDMDVLDPAEFPGTGRRTA